MPKVGMTRFPYTSAGAQQAQKFARQTGQKMSMKKGGSTSSKIKKVIKGLNKASKLHAGQAKTLKSVVKKKAKKRR
jgi:hypothetical protein|tara:strand:- start:178 stop:405 length:228 start_codon:yes stop_codon:yes gene_type:complete